MNIGRMAAALAVSAAAVTCSVLAAAPAQADEAAPSSAVAVAPAQADQASPDAAQADKPAADSLSAPALYDNSFTKSVQVASDNSDLDEYNGVQVWTRTPGYTYQNFTFTLVGRTFYGQDIYTIKGTTYNRCIQEFGIGNPVQLRDCDPNNLAQRWIVDDAWRYTLLESEKNPYADLQGNGWDRQVTLSYYSGRLDQWWRLYDK